MSVMPAAELPWQIYREVRQTFGVDAGRLAFVTQMWVDPTQRGHGVFDALMDAVLAHARDTGVDVVALHVYRSNERACAAYRRRGFALTSPMSSECPPDEAEYALHAA